MMEMWGHQLLDFSSFDKVCDNFVKTPQVQAAHQRETSIPPAVGSLCAQGSPSYAYMKLNLYVGFVIFTGILKVLAQPQMPLGSVGVGRSVETGNANTRSKERYKCGSPSLVVRW